MLVVTYLIYIVVSLGVTIWVARTLQQHGRAFLVNAFKDNEGLADSVNHLLVVGFYLINLGYVCITLKAKNSPVTVADAIELLSSKIGIILLVLGGMHFFNIYVFNRLRRSGLLEMFEPPVEPDQVLPNKI